MESSAPLDAKGQFHLFSVPEAKSPVVVVFLEIKFFGSVERNGRHLG